MVPTGGCVVVRRARTKPGQDAGRRHSSAMAAAGDAARRSVRSRGTAAPPSGWAVPAV